MSERFYAPEPLGPGEFVLSGAEAHHLATVRRFSAGDRILLFNGDGNEYPAEIISTDRKRAVVNVLSIEATNRELPFRVEIASAMPKGDRGDFLIEKLVELGVAKFTPLLTERTIVQPKESRLEKLQQTVIEASKQCGRNVLMQIGPLTKWEEIATAEHAGVRLILHPTGTTQSDRRVNPHGLRFAIGPEGGFTDSEMALAEKSGWIRMSLGSRILRIETAAIAAAAWAAIQ